MSTAVLTFVSGKFDITFGGLTVPLTRRYQQASRRRRVCELNPTNVSRNLIINRDAAPFDNPDLRRAMALSLDRKAFLDIITEGKGNVGGVMLPPPEGVWGMPPEVLHALPGYGPDVDQEPQGSPRRSCSSSATDLTNGLRVKVSTRDIPPFSRPGGDPDRSAEGDLYRRRARDRSTRPSGSRGSTARITPWRST